MRAEAEVVKPDHDHVAECVAAHPNEPCPGWPHPFDAATAEQIKADMAEEATP